MGDLDPIYIHASLGPSTSIIQMASKSTQPFLHGSWQNVIGDVGACPFPQNCPFPWGIWTARLTRGSLGLTTLSIPSPSQSGQPFLQGWRKGVPILYNSPHLSPKIAPSHGGAKPHLIHGSLGQPEYLVQTASRSVQPFLHGSLVWQTDRLRYSVCNNRLIYVRSTVMRLNNSDENNNLSLAQ